MRFKPIIHQCVVAGLLALPVPSWAVGLGRLTLQSGLGQALSAEIELTAVQPGELDTLTARLADQATYSNNKIDYGSALPRVRVVLEQRGARPVLKVSSSQPINEPFLDLLVELNWATGRLLREYTFLLDPPGFAATTAVEPAVTIPTQVLSPATPPATRPITAAAPVDASTAAQGAGADSYGPVKRGDTLGKIAARVKPESVTLEQMLTALYRANAQAFDGKNMNRLRAGPVLNVPNADAVAAITNVEAKKEIRLQAADWRAYRERLAGGVSSNEPQGRARQVPGADAQGTRQAATGTITTAVEDKGATAPGTDKLRLSKGETVPGSAGPAARAENSVAAKKAVAEANSRVAELEQQVKNLSRLLELKSPALQAQQAAAEPTKATTKAAPAPPATPSPASAAASVPVQTIAAAPVVAPLPTPAPTPAVTTAGTSTLPSATGPAATSAGDAAKAEATKAPTLALADTAKVDPPKPKPPLRPSQSQQDTSLLDDLLNNTYVVVGGIAAILLAIAYWVLARRRRRVTTKFEDSIGAGTDIRTSTVFGNTGGGVVNTGDNSLVSDFSREGLGNIDTGEVDPIAEAEVYLAYGRDNQAEEILRDALGKTPDRQEIRLKLLEIYAQQNKPTAFETVASEIFAATKGSGEIWAKAAQFGRGIDPANPLYAERGAQEGSATASAPPATAAIAEDRLPDSNMRVAAAVEKSAFETEFEFPEPPKKEFFVMPPALTPPEPVPVPAPVVVAQSGSSLSAPLAAAAAASVAAAAASRASAVHERAPLDFKLDSAANLEHQPTSPALDFVTLDGPITLTGATTLSGPSTLSSTTLASPSGDIWGEKPPASLHERHDAAPQFRADRLSELTTGALAMPAAAAATPALSPATGSSQVNAPQPSAKLELDKLDLSFNPSQKPFEDPTPSVLDGQWHDAATKLDLAKAYQEMGDVEGAREILQEVMQEGDEQQKKEAQTFLAKLRS